MKKTLLPFVAIAGILTLAAQAQAQTVVTSIQFTHGGPYNPPNLALQPTDVAGVDAVNNWNSNNGPNGIYGNVSGAYGYDAETTDSNSTPLVTSTGSNSGISFSIYSAGGAYSGSNYSPGPDYDLLAFGAATGGTGAVNSGTGTPYPAGDPVTLTLSGLDPLSNYSYDLYIGGGAYGAGYGSVSESGGNTYYFITPNGGNYNSPLTTYQNGSSTVNYVTTGSPIIQSYDSNYIYFAPISGVTSETFTLTSLGNFGGGDSFNPAAPGNNFAIGIAGIQVFATPAPVAAPEPASVWLMLAGLGAVGFYLRRKHLPQVQN